jgi:hypothetical protein
MQPLLLCVLCDIDPCMQGKVTPLREGTAAAASSVSVDRSCVWSLGQVAPAPSRSRDWLFALGSGAVQVHRLSSDDQADMVRVCSHQLSAAPVTGTTYLVPFNNKLFPGVCTSVAHPVFGAFLGILVVTQRLEGETCSRFEFSTGIPVRYFVPGYRYLVPGYRYMWFSTVPVGGTVPYGIVYS